MLLLGTKQLHLLLLTTLYHGLSVASPKGEYILKNSNTRGAVASESQECSRIGTYMLEIGVSIPIFETLFRMLTS